MFAAVDGMGRLDLWNLNNDTEVGARCLPPLSGGNWTHLSSRRRQSCYGS